MHIFLTYFSQNAHFYTTSPHLSAFFSLYRTIMSHSALSSGRMRPFFRHLCIKITVLHLEKLKGRKMDKLTDKNIDEEIKRNEKSSFLSKINNFSQTLNRIKNTEKSVLLYDLILFTVGFLLSRCHIIFGAYPLGLAFATLTGVGVWPTLLGVAIGYLSMGIRGIIFAAVAVISVILRASVSRDDKLFGEGLLIRMCIGVLCGFIAAVYEFLLYGLNEMTLLFSLSMIFLTPVGIFALSGLFSSKISASELLHSSSNLLSLENKDEKEAYNIIFFQISALVLIFSISLSFVQVVIMGVSLSYVFGAFITLAAAKRFGALRGMAVGFVSTLSTSGLHSVGFALAGLGAGLLFGIGGAQAIVIGGAALCSWSAYTSGLGGLLSTLPEYIIASIIGIPLFKKLTDAPKATQIPLSSENAEDMIGTMALAYQNRYSGSVDSLGNALSSMSAAIKDYFKQPPPPTADDYRDIVISVSEEHCSLCHGSGLCARENIRPCIKNADNIAELLSRGVKITPQDVNTSTEFCQMAELIAYRINKESARLTKERYSIEEHCQAAEEYELAAKLISNAICRDDAERSVDNNLTPSLTEAMEKSGFGGGVIRAFGERKKHFFLAGEDPQGNKITSPQIRKSIEQATGVALATPEYFRKGKMVLMECGIKRQLSVSFAIAERGANDIEISGDSTAVFSTENDFFYSLISDGMGSGEVAKDTSTFVCDFMKSALSAGADKQTLMYMLNHTVKAQREECSATVDLFEIDTLTGEATFMKSGAAPSYVKRESSIFRIRSQTAPIGLMKTVDCEKTKVEIKPGDYIIMLSDGIAETTEDAPWLLLLLGQTAESNLQSYADWILDEAVKNNGPRDDMSVVVIRVDEA